MKKKLLRIFSSVLCLCMLTTACGGGTEDAGNGDDGGEAKDTLTIAVQADMADKDPINGSSTNDTLKIKANVYETLIERTVPEGEYKPLLAESWEFNDDATELTMTLREGVMCHNGGRGLPLLSALPAGELQPLCYRPYGSGKQLCGG